MILRFSRVTALTILVSVLVVTSVTAQTLNNLPLITGTYLGGSGNDSVYAVDIAPNGDVIVGGVFPDYNPGGVLPVALLDSTTYGHNGLVIIMSTDSRSVKSAYSLGDTVTDLEVAANGDIAACGSFGMVYLDSSASYNPTMHLDVQNAIGRCSVAAGTIVGMEQRSGSDRIHVYQSNGTELGVWNSGGSSRQYSDVAVHGASATVIETGYDQKAGDLQVAFMIGRSTNGNVKWTNWDFSANAVKSASLAADSRGLRVAIGRDGALYFAGYVDGGNAIYKRNPSNINQQLGGSQLITTDSYNNPFNISGSRSLGWYGRFNASNGSIDKGQFLLTRLSDGKGNSIGIKSITADASGVIYVSGDAYASIQDRSKRKVADQAVGNYSGGEPYALVVSPDMSQRLIWTPFTATSKSAGNSPANAINVRGGTVALGVGLNLGSGQRLVTHDALQSNVSGGGGDGYLAVWANDYELPDVPVLSAPGVGATVNDASPNFTWTGSEAATEYRLMIRETASKNRVFKQWIAAETLCNGTSCSLDISDYDLALRNRPHQWRVMARNPLGKTKTSWQGFTVEFPGKPTVTAPADDAITSRTPTITWDAVNAADEYRVIVKRVRNKKKFKSDWLRASEVCNVGTCTYTISEANRLGGGKHKLKLQARADSASNRSKSGNVTFRVDKTLAPDIQDVPLAPPITDPPTTGSNERGNAE